MSTVPFFASPPPPPPSRPLAQEGAYTVSALLDAYEREYVPSQAPTTQYQKRRMYLFFRAELGHLRLDELTPQVLRQWRDSLAQRFTSGTVRRYMDMLRAP